MQYPPLCTFRNLCPIYICVHPLCFFVHVQKPMPHIHLCATTLFLCASTAGRYSISSTSNFSPSHTSHPCTHKHTIIPTPAMHGTARPRFSAHPPHSPLEQPLLPLQPCEHLQAKGCKTPHVFQDTRCHTSLMSVTSVLATWNHILTCCSTTICLLWRVKMLQ